jgi:hypothetical protein
VQPPLHPQHRAPGHTQAGIAFVAGWLWSHHCICAKGKTAMATYIVIINFTEQGIRNIKDSPKRAAAATEPARGC